MNEQPMSPRSEKPAEPLWAGQGWLFPPSIPSDVLPTHTTAGRHPVHRWFGFVPGFSPEYVRECVAEAQLTTADTVLDPFAGCGTTLVECNSLGISSLGFEPHPFLADVCRAKLLIGKTPSLVHEIQDRLEAVPTIEPTDMFAESALVFLKKLFPAASLEKLAGARQACARMRGDKAMLARLIVSRVLDFCSHSKTDGIYKAPSSRKIPARYSEALNTICSRMSADLGMVRHASLRNLACLFGESSEHMGRQHGGPCSALVTSPPYLNNFDFAEMTRMYLYFWGYANSWSEITKRVRSKLIVNTTTSLTKEHRDVGRYKKQTPQEIHQTLDSYCNLLAERKQAKAGKKEYDALVYPYFAQMTRVMSAARTMLAADSQVKIIISDAALYGVHVRAHEVLAVVLESIGFADVRLRRLRERGTRWILDKREGAADGLGEYELSAVAPRRRRSAS